MRPLLVASLFLIATAPAQTCIYTWGTDPAGTLPPRTNGRSFFLVPNADGYFRTQLLLPVTLFGNVPLRIPGFSIPVKEGWRRVRYPQLTVRMGQTTRSQLSLVFAQNVQIPARQELLGQTVLGQYLALRSGSNALGALAKNCGRLLIGR